MLTCTCTCTCTCVVHVHVHTVYTRCVVVTAYFIITIMSIWSVTIVVGGRGPDIIFTHMNGEHIDHPLYM